MNSGAVPALESSVLLLNKLYMPVRVISARRAFCLLAKDLAEVITLDDGAYRAYDFDEWRARSSVEIVRRGPDDDYVRTVRSFIEVPRIIRLLGYDRLPRQRVKFNRRNVFARDENRCQYCGRRLTSGQLSLDHITPRSQGGPSTWENIVCACLPCNHRKGPRTPPEAGMPLLKDPVRPQTNPSLRRKLATRKYKTWKVFLEHASWPIEVS
ncbi:MAG TPA: HNH endonuclease [Isosphaeraceae bacterium]|jgi:5-methylcytosine-specific restriction endonuclease McrA|nr:HNH endonuclease [Isosphaeraceae bacterium]